MERRVIDPGGTLGILGGGQLARMLALEARRMGYRVGVLDLDPSGPGGQVADFSLAAGLGDAAALSRFGSMCDVVTLDTEHVPWQALRTLQAVVPVRPGFRVLEQVQDRAAQRAFLSRLGAPQPRHARVDDLPSLRRAAEVTGLPGILKRRTAGYDGKGQARIERAEDLEPAFESLGAASCVLEQVVPFEREISALVARGLDGQTRGFAVAENHHVRGILKSTRVPARVPPRVAARAVELATEIAAALEHVGVLALELFATPEDELLVNEIAPRVHNSGHFSFGACLTSQFEQHVRAVCGLELGAPTLLAPARMLNVLGDAWQSGEPDWRVVHAQPTARLHLYGKPEARPGRKMAHVLVVDQDEHAAERALAAIEAGLTATGHAGAPCAL